MDYEIIKTSVKSIEMTDEMKKSIIRNCKNITSKSVEITTQFKEKNKMFKHKYAKILIAAALVAVFAVTAGAIATFVMPKDLIPAEIESIKTVVDFENADKDSIKTVQKTFSNDEFTVTFEAIVEGKCMEKFFENENTIVTNGSDGVAVDKTYAVLTVKRNDGKPVLYYDENGLLPRDIGYRILIKGYMTNPSMLVDNYDISLCEEDNILYVACDITDANVFADEELYLAFTNKMVINYEIVEMDKNGNFSYAKDYDGIPALFDFELDSSKADHEKAAEYKASQPFFTFDEFQKLLAEEE